MYSGCDRRFVTSIFLDGKHGVSDINYNNNTGKPEKQKSPQSFFSQKFGADSVPQCQTTLNPGLAEELTVWGYRPHLGRLVATLLAVLLTAGLLHDESKVTKVVAVTLSVGGVGGGDLTSVSSPGPG